MGKEEQLQFLAKRINSFVQPDGKIKINEDFANTLIAMAKIDVEKFYKVWGKFLLFIGDKLEKNDYLCKILLYEVLHGLCYLNSTNETERKPYLAVNYKVLTANLEVNKIVFKYDSFSSYTPILLRAAIGDGNVEKAKEIIDILFFERKKEPLDKLYKEFYHIVPNDNKLKKVFSDMMKKEIEKIKNQEERDRIYVLFMQHHMTT